MRILCIYFDEEPSWLAPDPEKIFSRHEVTCVHDYDSAVALICDPQRGIPYFDIVLSDVRMPGNPKEPIGPYGPMLMRHTENHLIRGLGLFANEDSTEAFAHTLDDYDVMVASTTCWNVFKHRDWEKLFKMVVMRIDMADARH